MPPLLLVTPEGMVVNNNPPRLSDEVGVYTTENELWIIAAKEHERVNTHKKVTKQ
jgi:hypothetical protein